MQKINSNFIAGAWVPSVDVLKNINPSDTNDVIGEFASAAVSETEQAIDSAFAAFPAWSRSSPQLRHDMLKNVGDEILVRKEELGRLLSREEGKTLAEGVAEVVRAGQIFQFYAGESLRIAGDRLDSARTNVEIEIAREAVGVVGLITPWNFPIAIPAWKIAPALAYGNCVVFKPAELVPASAHALTEILARSGIPEGVFNLVMGAGSVAGQTILNSAKVAAVSFTGSVATGRKIAQSCVLSSPMKKMQLEMGGKNPLIVLDDADLDFAIECAVNGAYFATGQRCTASSRLIVTENIHDRFVAGLSERIRELVVDHALKADSQMGPVVDQKQFDQDNEYIRVGIDEGAKLSVGGEQLKRGTPGFYLSPALFTEANNDMRIAREEIFGPIAAVIRVADYESALQVANDTEFGLSAGICTTSLKYAQHFKRNSEAGTVMVNLPTAGTDYFAPFGGRKGSSYGSREQGRYAVEFYTTVKTAYTTS